MKRLPRTQFGNPVLQKSAKLIPRNLFGSRSLKRLIAQMFFTVKRIGVGLAAPQIGKSLQLAVIEIKKTPIRPDVRPLAKTVIINPRIVWASKKRINDWEGCLSCPRLRGLVPRCEYIKVEYFDEIGKKHVATLKGFQARVFQHEIDHLNGVVYVERMKNLKTLMMLQEFNARVLGRGLKSR
jgi:peptide deformylase